MSRRLFVPLLVGLSLLVVPAAAAAKVNISVGIANQSLDMFASHDYQALHLKKTRYFIEWNAIDQPADLAAADQFVAVARALHVKVLMHISTDNINAVPRSKLPSVSQYRKKVGALVKRYKPMGVKDWGVWNEANHKSQPTSKNPKRAAQFFKQMRSVCKGCKIVALDVLDQAGVQSYIKRWFKALGHSYARKASVIGIHNYSEVNRKLKHGSKKYPGTKRIIDTSRKYNHRAKFWYTETGGLTAFGKGFPCNEKRAANRTAYMFTLAKKYRKYIQRLYTYNWTGTSYCGSGSTAFDAGLVNPNGTLRPAYSTLKSKLKGFKK